MDWIMTIAWTLHDLAGLAGAVVVTGLACAAIVLYVTPFEDR